MRFFHHRRARDTRRFARELENKGIEFLDCPVSGGTKAAEAATLTILVGGREDVLARAKPLLEKLGSNIFHMGPVGCGQVTKACNQTVQVIAIQGIAEAMLFAKANGVDGNKVVEALMSGFAGSKMLGLMGPKMANRDFAAGIEARLHHKDFGLVRNMAEQQGLAHASAGAGACTAGEIDSAMDGAPWIPAICCGCWRKKNNLSF